MTDAARAQERDYDILNSLGDGVYITDLDRQILFWNEAAERITGWRADQIMGTSCFDDILVHTDMGGQKLCGKEFCPLHRAIVQEEASRLPEIVFAQTSSGSRVPVEVTVAPLRAADGTVIGGIESFRDLSPLLHDLEHARLIQTGSMHWKIAPDARVAFGVRSVPLTYVSGDFSRVQLLGSNCYVFMVADVMGHGVAAALHTMQISSLWLEEGDLLGRPAEFMRQVNGVLSELTPDEDFFASAILGVYHADTRQLEYVNAGHPPPLLCRAHAATSLEGGGAALGLLPDSEYTPHAISLAIGDRLLFYSDGCIEITGRDGTELGSDGLAALFSGVCGESPKQLADNLADALLRHSEHPRFGDDITLLCMQVNA